MLYRGPIYNCSLSRLKCPLLVVHRGATEVRCTLNRFRQSNNSLFARKAFKSFHFLIAADGFIFYNNKELFDNFSLTTKNT